MAGETIPTLRSLIDSGGSPVDVLAGFTPVGIEDNYPLESLADLLCCAITDRENRERQLEGLARRESIYRDDDGGDALVALDLERMRLQDAWEGELLRNPEMVDEVVATVADAFDRAILTMRVDTSRCGYPLKVDWNEGTWRCDGCGTCFEADEAPMVWVGEREGQTNSPTDSGYGPSWCVPCVEAVVERAKRLTA